MRSRRQAARPFHPRGARAARASDAMDLTEKTLKSSLVFQGVFLKVRQDEVALPDGGTAPREWVEHPGAAAMAPIFDDGRILVVRQYRYAPKLTFVEIPAGKLDPGEGPLQTARRELVEETGYRANAWAFLTRLHPAIGFSNEIIDVFLCRDLVKAEQQLEHGELIELDVVTIGWLVDELRAGRLTDVKTQIAAMWLERIDSGQWPWPSFDAA